MSDPVVKAQLTLTLYEGGTINISGPFGDKVLVYGMMELAKDAIREYHEAQKKGEEPPTNLVVARRRIDQSNGF